MTIQFYVEGTLWIEDRQELFLLGSTESGTVEVGMSLHVPLNDALFLTAKVRAVTIAGVSLLGKMNQLELIELELEPDEQEIFHGLNLSDERFEIHP